VVPSWDFVVNIWISPFFGLKVVYPDVVVLHLSVPSTIDVDFTFTGEETVSSSAVWGVVVWNELLPNLSSEIEAVQIVEGNTSVVKTSMSSEEIHFILINACANIGSWSWSSAGGLKVSSVVLVASNSSPFHGFDLKEPGVVESRLWAVMSTKKENLISLWGVQSTVLSSGKWLVCAVCDRLGPCAVHYK